MPGSRTYVYLRPCARSADVFAQAAELDLVELRVERGPDGLWRGAGLVRPPLPRPADCTCDIPPRGVHDRCAIAPDCPTHGGWTRRVRELTETTGATTCS